MPGAFEPKECEATGRVLTEWWEEPEHTPEYIRAKMEESAATADNPVTAQARLMQTATAFMGRKWRGAMSKQEVAHRLNKASTMTDPSNYKFLAPEVTSRTGLEINPLWLMECIVRSGTLGPKDQIAALKELAAYTHSKAPALNQNINHNMSHEDWILEIAKSEYSTVDDAEIIIPVQKREHGHGKKYERQRKNRLANFEKAEEYSSGVIETLYSETPEDYSDVDLEALFNDGSTGDST